MNNKIRHQAGAPASRGGQFRPTQHTEDQLSLARTPRAEIILKLDKVDQDVYDEDAGTAIAAALRELADEVEGRINIGPYRGGEWTDENYAGPAVSLRLTNS